MKHYLQSILIVFTGLMVAGALIAGMCFGIKLIIEGWEVVNELKEICVSCK